MKDLNLRSTYKFRSCVVCRRKPCDPSHIKTYGATGLDSSANIIPLCREHHSEWHQRGAMTTIEKYPRLKNKLIEMGWEFLSNGKLWHPALDPKRDESWRHST